MAHTIESISAYLNPDSVSIGDNQYTPEEIISLATLALYQALEGDHSGLDNLLKSLPNNGVLLTQAIEGKNSPLQLIRQALESGDILIHQEPEQGLIVSNRVVEDLPRPSLATVMQRLEDQESQKRRRDRQTIKEPAHEVDIFSDLLIASTPADLHNVARPELIKKVHIVRHGVGTFSSLRLMIDLFPNLEEITVAPTNYGHIFQSNSKIDFLAKHGIRLQNRRFRNWEMYDQTFPSDDYLAKQELYQSIILGQKDIELKQLLKEMNKMEIINLDLLHQYLGGDEPTSTTKLAIALKVKHSWVAKELAAVLYLLGFEYEDYQLCAYARNKLTRFQRLQTAQADAKAFEELRQEYAVNNLLPPASLHMGGWETWQKIQNLIINQPEKWAQFSHQSPRKHFILSAYFQIGEYRDEPTSLRKLGDKLEVSRERIKALRDRGLNILDILE